MASLEPVDAPEGTAARPLMPDSSTTSASIVGLPRESRISRAMTSTIALMSPPESSAPRRRSSSANLIVADEPIGNFTLHCHDLLMPGIRAIGVEIGAGGERHVDAKIVGDRTVGRIPTILEAHDPGAVLRQRH